jgi:mono/diheme cytochrome c family protein
MPRRVLLAAAVVSAGLAVSACGSQGIQLDEGESPEIRAGAQIFSDKCAMCHTLEAVGSEGSAVSVSDRERIDGPNFNVREEQYEQILYAIYNGGFSGAIMPENIVTGEEARYVARFLEKYAGRQAEEQQNEGTGQPAPGSGNAP